MFSQRGVLNLGHSEQEMRDLARRVSANRLNGIDAELLSAEEVGKLVPVLNTAPDTRYPVLGGTLQRRGGVARHDAGRLGLRPGRRRAGRGHRRKLRGHRHPPRQRPRHRAGDRARRNPGGHGGAWLWPATASVLAAMADIRLPIESHPLQALVTEPLKPVLDPVVMSNAVHVYVSQTDRGELVLGAGIDASTSYDMRGSFRVIEHTLAAVVELFPIFSRVRMLRQWAGIVDICPDASPIISGTPIEGLFINCGWGTGGFKATPGSGWVFAHTLANREPHPLNAPFSLDRFATGALIDEARRSRRGPLIRHAADSLSVVRTARGRRIHVRRRGRYRASQRPGCAR